MKSKDFTWPGFNYTLVNDKIIYIRNQEWPGDFVDFLASHLRISPNHYRIIWILTKGFRFNINLNQSHFILAKVTRFKKCIKLSGIRELIFIYCGLFVLILVVFGLFLLSLRFGQISPLAFFRWFTTTSDRNDESCNRIPSNYCLP